MSGKQAAVRAKTAADPFKGLRNAGPATRSDLKLLGIDSLAKLAASEPDELYRRIQDLTAHAHDPCVWDTFAAVVHQARTGEALDWWSFTPERKTRQARGEFPVWRKSR